MKEERRPVAQWPAEQIDHLVGLTLDWFGNDEGEDGDLHAWLEGGLIARYEPDRFDPPDPSPLRRLPLSAAYAGRLPLAEALLDKTLSVPRNLETLGTWLLVAAQYGWSDWVGRLLSARRQALLDRARWFGATWRTSLTRERAFSRCCSRRSRAMPQR
jgi:hypothetical protein